MSIQSHVAVLKEKHQALEMAILEEFNRPQPDSIALATLKRRKLRIKEELQGIEVD